MLKRNVGSQTSPVDAGGHTGYGIQEKRREERRGKKSEGYIEVIGSGASK